MGDYFINDSFRHGMKARYLPSGPGHTQPDYLHIILTRLAQDFRIALPRCIDGVSICPQVHRCKHGIIGNPGQDSLCCSGAHVEPEDAFVARREPLVSS